MSVKASVSLTDAQEDFARGLVAAGRFPSLSAVVQQGLELLRVDTEARAAETEALRALLAERRAGSFVEVEEGRARTEGWLEARRAGLGLEAQSLKG